MGDVTPFQRQVLNAAESYEAKQKEKKREEMQQQHGGGGPSAGRTRNPRAQSSGGSSDMGQTETVRYINKNEYPDHEVHQD